MRESFCRSDPGVLHLLKSLHHFTSINLAAFSKVVAKVPRFPSKNHMDFTQTLSQAGWTPAVSEAKHLSENGGWTDVPFFFLAISEGRMMIQTYDPFDAGELWENMATYGIF